MRVSYKHIVFCTQLFALARIELYNDRYCRNINIKSVVAGAVINYATVVERH
jgi:hypothetical protein